ncbi:CoA transferase [Pseudonocardia sp. RS010]|uniref:CoA transferase n=1 Tax=Pseudonocardia sp. RS010 TaxID=3385979 RepID=UPI0039A1BE37
MPSRLAADDQPLAGVEVLEVSGGPSGAYCGRVLRLLGASVVRVDLPLVADVPAHLRPDLGEVLHEGKRALAADGPVSVRKVLMRCDVVVADSSGDDAADGAVAALTTDLLAACPPDTPLVDVAGLRDGLEEGTDEPCASIVATAASGMSWGLGHPGEPPLTLPYDLPEYLTGTEAAAVAALAVLLRRGIADPGRRWDVCSADVLPYERPWRRDGARATMSGGSYPAAMFPCRDGWVSIMCRTQREYRGLLSALGHPQWSTRPGFDDSRVVARLHADEADRHVMAWTGAHTRAEVFSAGREHGFPVAPVSSLGEALGEEQFAHRDFFARDGRGRRRAGSPFQLYGPSSDAPPRTSNWPAGGATPSSP